MAHVSEQKKKIVKKITDLMTQYPIIGALDLESLPAPQLQTMKSQLRGKVEIFMAKRRLIKIAIEQVKDSKKGIEALSEKLEGMPALLFTKENPFSLFKTLKKSKSSAPAKGGQIAPKDIEVKAGPTPFLPGPIIGELGALGIKTGVEGGKVAIKEDKIVVKEGETITDAQAALLTRLGIEPMEIGLNVTSIYEDGVIYDRKTLNIDEEQFMANLTQAGTWGFNLAMEISYPSSLTLPLLVGKAFNDAKALGLSQDILEKGIIEDLLGKAERQTLSLKNTANIEVQVKPKEEKKEEPKQEAPQDKEEVKEEKPVEEKKEDKPAEEKPKEAPLEKKEEKPVEEKKEPKEDSPKEETKPKEKKEETPNVPEKKPETLPEEVKEEPKKKPEEKKTTDDKVADMVNKMKKHAKGDEPSAQDLINDL